jgi:thioredoxin-like negative regulator of GroEL
MTSTVMSCPDTAASTTCIEEQKDLELLLTKSQGPIFVYFYMNRCGWCEKMKPIIKKLSTMEEFNDISFYNVNGQELQAAPIIQNSLQLTVRGYPFMIMMNQGKLIEQQIGGVDEDILTEKLRTLLKAYYKTTHKN